MHHHSKSLSFLYEKATGRVIDQSQVADLYKFACLVRAEVIKDERKAANKAVSNTTLAK